MLVSACASPLLRLRNLDTATIPPRIEVATTPLRTLRIEAATTLRRIEVVTTIPLRTEAATMPLRIQEVRGRHERCSLPILGK